MTIRTATGEIFEGRAAVDDHGAEGARYQLAVALQGGWRIVDSTPAERTMLEAHGFGSGRVQ